MQPINVALCSFGMSGWVFHAPFITQNPGFKFYAVWERSKDLARQKYPDVKVFRDLDEMLADPAVERVVLPDLVRPEQTWPGSTIYIISWHGADEPRDRRVS